MIAPKAGDRRYCGKALSSILIPVLATVILVCLSVMPAAGEKFRETSIDSLQEAKYSAKVYQRRVGGDRIRLGDLIPERREPAIDLGPTPAIGTARRISRKEIEEAMGKPFDADLTQRFAEGTSWSVRRAEQVVSCERWRALVRAALSRHLERSLTLRDIGCSRPHRFAAGQLILSAELLPNARKGGRQRARIIVHAGNQRPQMMITAVTVGGTIQTVVAKKTLSVGESPSRQALGVERRAVDQIPTDALVAAEEVNGQEMRARLRAGQVLRKRHLRPLPHVRRGAMVTVAVRLPGLNLTSRGSVRADGRIGDIVPVLCAASNKLIRARVIGTGRVQVDL